MSTTTLHFLRLARWLCLGLGLVAASAMADPVRVTTWNLQMAGGVEKAEESRIPEAAAALKKLDPEVIILQNVRDWQMCGQLAQALKPTVYSVLVCSSFRDAKTGASSKQQVAILAKNKAYFSWSEAWRSEGPAAIPGGFAFVAVQMGKERVGIFSVQLGDGLVPADASAIILRAREAAVRQVLTQVETVKHWENNQVRSFVVAGVFNTNPEDPLGFVLSPVEA